MLVFINFVLLMWSFLMLVAGIIPLVGTFGEIHTTDLMVQLVTLRMLAMAVIWMALFAFWIFAERYKE
ncbi:hypothetical protein ACU6TU_09800 [Halomonas sp. LS-001]